VRRLVEGAAKAASSSNLQPWNVYAVTGEPLKEIKRQALDAFEKRDWRALETEYPDMPENLWEPYLSRRFVFGDRLYGSLGINRNDKAGRRELANEIFSFTMRQSVSSSRLIAGWALVNGRTSAAMSAHSPSWRADMDSTPALR
jgi:nitroreductase